MNLLDFYTELTASLGLIADETGYLSMDTTPPQPVMVEGKRLCLPTAEILSKKDIENTTIFHPLCELLTRGESEVLRELKLHIQRRYTAQFSMTLIAIALLLNSEDALTAAQTKWLAEFKKWSRDGAGIETIQKFVTKGLTKSVSSVVSIYLKSGGEQNNQSYKRLAVISFPILEELDKDKPYGITMTANDRKQLKAIVQKMIGEESPSDAYNTGTNEDVAPRFVALVGATEKLIRKLDKTSTVFKKVIPNYSKYETNLGWVAKLPEAMARSFQIPQQQGNLGVTLTGSGNKETVLKEEPVVATRSSLPADDVPARQPTNDLNSFLRKSHGIDDSDRSNYPFGRFTGAPQEPVNPLSRFYDNGHNGSGVLGRLAQRGHTQPSASSSVLDRLRRAGR